MLTQVHAVEVCGGYRKREPLQDRFRAAIVGADAGSRVVCTATGLFVGFRMTNHPSRRRINFRDVAVGQRFYDQSARNTSRSRAPVWLIPTS